MAKESWKRIKFKLMLKLKPKMQELEKEMAEIMERKTVKLVQNT